MLLTRPDILPEACLPNSEELLNEGKKAAKLYSVGPNPFLKTHCVKSEAEFKRKNMFEKCIMQHAQVGFRDLEKSCRAYAEIYESCQSKNVTVDRYGLCLDWSMGYPVDLRKKHAKGTGLVLPDIDDFIRLTSSAPVAPHFGDFVMGMPAAFDNTKAALAAGSTTIGNLGQYFTFRLPDWDNEIKTTEETIKALGLVAAQEEEILVHSNLDDGFAGLLCDLSCCLGVVMLEKYIINGLIGAKVSHCYGHHFSDPTRRMAFHIALAQISETPGTIIYGNTTQYRGNEQENYASLKDYISVDIEGQRLRPTGHAINPVPVSENLRIPDIDEIIDAQLFAAKLRNNPLELNPSLDMQLAQSLANKMVVGALNFQTNILNGYQQAGIDIHDPVEMLLATKRIGGKRLEQLFGPGRFDDSAPRGRQPIVPSTFIDENNEAAKYHLSQSLTADRQKVSAASIKVITASTDVHEHGKILLDTMLVQLGVKVVDGGISVDADDLVKMAFIQKVDAIAIGTYNGIALSFAQDLKEEIAKYGTKMPVIFGGRLNQIPENSNTSLPVDVTEEIRQTGASVCQNMEDVIPFLANISTS